MNIFERFVDKYYYWKWDMESLSENPSITPIFIEKYPHWGWNMYYLSRNPSINDEFVKKYPEGIRGLNSDGIGNKPWNWILLARNNSISFELLEEKIVGNSNIDMREFMYALFSRYNGIKPEHIERHPDWPWEMDSLSESANITPEFVEKNINGKGLDLEWDIMQLSCNINLTEKFILEHKDWDWFPLNIRHNPSISKEFFIKYFKDFINDEDFTDNEDSDEKNHEPAITSYISDIERSKTASLEYIKNNPKIGWDIWYLSKNPNITLKFVEENSLNYFKKTGKGMKFDWDMISLSQNKFSKDINIERRLIFLLGCYDDNKTPISNFRKNFLFDRNLVGKIFF